QRHRLGEHADDEKVVFDVVHAVVAADNLRVMNRTDQNPSRPTRLFPGGPSVRPGREGADSGHKEKDAHLSISLPAGWQPADSVSWLVHQNHTLNGTSSFFWSELPVAVKV